MVVKKVLAFLLSMLATPLLADDCIKYKKNPSVYLDVPKYTVTIEQPDTELDLSLHGNVAASMIIGNSISADVVFIKKGFCVSVERVDLDFGYNDFKVQIDKNYEEGSCAYDAVMMHEQKHINAYLSVMDDFKADLQKAAFTAADSIMPVFIKTKSEINNVIEKFNDDFQNHPDLLLVKQKILAEQEIRNNKIDQDEDGAELMKCFE